MFDWILGIVAVLVIGWFAAKLLFPDLERSPEYKSLSTMH
jgi:hypothetical protein